MHVLGTASTLLLCAMVCSQTYVVDAANGPGSHFVDLPLAVATVPDGATLDVRPGSYSPCSWSAKGLSILGQGTVYVGATAFSSLQVTGTLPHQTVVISGLTFPSNTAPYAHVDLGSCQGLVALQGLHALSTQRLVSASGCPRVHLHSCSGAGISCNQGDLVVESSGIDGSSGMNAHVAITATASNVHLVSSTVRGGSGGFGLSYGVPCPGIQQSGGTVTVLGSRVDAGANYYYPFQVPAVIGSGTLRVAADSLLVPYNAPATTGVTVTWPPLVRVNATNGPPGGSLTGAVRAAGGDLAVLVLGWPGPPQSLPGSSDVFWLDASQHHFAAFGVATAGQPITAAVVIPPNTGLRGLAVVWQAATFGAQNGFLVANPAVAFVQ